MTLEIGCGSAQYGPGPGRYVGVDRSASEYKVGLARRPDVVADGAALPFRDHRFDIVFLSNTFYLVADPERTLTDIKRVIRTRGWVFVFDYTAPVLRRLAGQYPATVRTYGDWVLLMREHGWRRVSVTINTSPLRRAVLRLFPHQLRAAQIDGRHAGIVVRARA